MKFLWLEWHWWDLISLSLSACLGFWCQRLVSRFRYPKIIGGECSETLGPLLIRYKIFDSRYFGIFLHHLMRSDIERDKHDHPWSFLTILLTGEYVEHTLCGKKRYTQGSILWRAAEWQHALQLNKPMWTLVFVGPTRRPWGFHTKNGWQFWKTYKYASGDECGK